MDFCSFGVVGSGAGRRRARCARGGCAAAPSARSSLAEEHDLRARGTARARAAPAAATVGVRAVAHAAERQVRAERRAPPPGSRRASTAASTRRASAASGRLGLDDRDEHARPPRATGTRASAPSRELEGRERRATASATRARERRHVLRLDLAEEAQRQVVALGPRPAHLAPAHLPREALRRRGRGAARGLADLDREERAQRASSFARSRRSAARAAARRAGGGARSRAPPAPSARGGARGRGGGAARAPRSRRATRSPRRRARRASPACRRRARRCPWSRPRGRRRSAAARPRPWRAPPRPTPRRVGEQLLGHVEERALRLVRRRRRRRPGSSATSPAPR